MTIMYALSPCLDGALKSQPCSRLWLCSDVSDRRIRKMEVSLAELTDSTPATSRQLNAVDDACGSEIKWVLSCVAEDATPDLVRDFFGGDQFRPKWDAMLTYVKILEECSDTGLMTVHLIKKGVSMSNFAKA